MTRIASASVLAVALLGLAAPAAADLLDDLAGGDPLTGGAAQLLPADQAFILGVERQADRTIVLHWTIADDYYLYRDRMKFALVGADDARLGQPWFAPAKVKQDPFFGRVAVYYDEASVRIPLIGDPPASARLSVTYQGCNEPVGVCYPPVTKSVPLSAIALPAGSGAPGNPGDAAAGSDRGSEQRRIAAAIGSQRLWWTALAFIGFGLLLTFTPCVLPMIPILSAVITGGRPASGSRRPSVRAVLLSAIFVLAMALTYAAVGVAVALTGASIQAWFQQPWVLGIFAGIFVLLAAAMFGLFSLQLPGALRDRIEARTRGLGGKPAGAAMLGAASAVVVSPCVTPPLVGALIYIANTGDPVTGGIALFALGLGMGIPLLIAGTAAGRWLPRAGRWLVTVRQAFGVALLAVALWLLQRIVPAPVAMALWAVLLVVTGVQMGALSAAAAGWGRLWKGLGTVLVLYGALLLVGAAGGGHSVLRPLAGLFDADTAGSVTAREFRDIDGLADLRQALAEARRTERAVVLDIYADWCIACKRLEAFTFPHPAVQRAFGNAMLLRADVTANDAADQALLQRFDLYGPPAVLFFGPNGVERRGFRLVGYMGPEAFAARVRRAIPRASDPASSRATVARAR